MPLNLTPGRKRAGHLLLGCGTHAVGVHGTVGSDLTFIVRTAKSYGFTTISTGLCCPRSERARYVMTAPRHGCRAVGTWSIIACVLRGYSLLIPVNVGRLLPQPFKPSPGNSRVVHGVARITMAEVMLHGPQIGSLIGEVVPTGVAPMLSAT